MHLFVNVPFSKKNFALIKKKYGSKYFQIYYELLVKELSFFSYKSCETIYIGGVSPNIIEIPNLLKLISLLQDFLSSSYEFSIELDPEFIFNEQLEVLAISKINRFSLKLQSTNDEVLNGLKTNLNREKIIKILEFCQKSKMNNISADLTFNLANQTNKTLKRDIDLLNYFKISHISSYETKLNFNNSDLTEKLFFSIQKYLFNNGYRQYEICSFSKNTNFQCKHSLAYWQTEDWVGVGYGANSYSSGLFSVNKGNWKNYSKKHEQLSLEKLYFTVLMLGLRITKGIYLGEKKFLDAFNFFRRKILKNNNFVITEDNYLKLENTNILDNSLKYLL